MKKRLGGIYRKIERKRRGECEEEYEERERE